MSDKTTTDKPVINIAPQTEEAVEAVEKPSFIQKRVVNPIKSHPKVAAAILGGVALVGAAAVAGRKTAPSATLVTPLELESSDYDDVLIVESHDVQTTD